MPGYHQHFAAGELRRFLCIAALVLAAELGGLACDLSPRAPENPGGDPGPLVGLSDPDSVTLQIKLGLEGGFITSYMNAFADDFGFHPDAADSASLVIENPGVFDNWNKDVERNTMQVVFSRFTNRSVTFVTVPGESAGTGPGTVEVAEDYDLLLDSETYQGRALLSMRLDGSGDWRITQWHDSRRQGSQLPSWSVLRGENRAGSFAPASEGGGRPAAPTQNQVGVQGYLGAPPPSPGPLREGSGGTPEHSPLPGP